MVVNGLKHPHQVRQYSDVHDGDVNEAMLCREAFSRLQERKFHAKMNSVVCIYDILIQQSCIKNYEFY